MNESAERWLLADIGGTNSRVALYENQTLAAVHKFRNAQFATIELMLRAAIVALRATPTAAVIAIAGPTVGDDLRLSNRDWSFNRPALRETLGLKELHVVNDFEALAYAVPLLGPGDYVQVGGGGVIAGLPCVLIGPGTGLGVASLIHVDGHDQAIPGEGGHVTLAATNADEANLIAKLQMRFDHCSAERVLSGDGLEVLHATLSGDVASAAEISAAAHDGDSKAVATFMQFFAFLGTIAGNAALTLGARGGVYIGGGIVPANQKLFERSPFRERFVDKGRFRDYLDPIATRVITADTPALTGLAGFVNAQC
ncbi:MAG: glucokinase [Pseudomonadota bacterium]